MARRQCHTCHPRGDSWDHRLLSRGAPVLEAMKRDAYTRTYLWLVAHRRLVLLVLLVITAACVVFSTRINLEQDALAVLPKHDTRVNEFRYAARKFRQIDRVFLDVGIDRDDPDQLVHAADEIYAALSKTTNFARILYRIDAN